LKGPVLGDHTNKLMIELIREIGLDPDQCGDFSLTFPVAGVVKGTFDMFMTAAQVEALKEMISQKPNWRAKFNILLLDENGKAVKK
jgi:hypothetical protein